VTRALVLLVAVALAGCATITDKGVSEKTAIQIACRSIKAAYGPRSVRCTDLEARLSAEDTQWVVIERTDGLHPTGAALSRQNGRVLNTWR